MVNHPPHYAHHPCFTMECHSLATMMTFDAGNALKYLWRWSMKGKEAEDLDKAAWYLDHTDQVFRLPPDAWPAEWTDLHAQALGDTDRWCSDHAGEGSVMEASIDAIERLLNLDVSTARKFTTVARERLTANGPTLPESHTA
ncbi:MAG TPA: hypothetical protein DCL06_06220 [Corynebacterium variabile]|uniref:DUF3310 domain-containing protein n=1 Tax=Corynebacterium variabile TaxID=1727 RepID=A0A3B9QU80_9CORY|nr:hypothetical protein [Corynebacterium variabile]